MSDFEKWPGTFVFYFFGGCVFGVVSIMLWRQKFLFSIMMWRNWCVTILSLLFLCKFILSNGYKYKNIGYFRKKNG